MASIDRASIPSTSPFGPCARLLNLRYPYDDPPEATARTGSGGTSFTQWGASGIVHGTQGLWREQALADAPVGRALLRGLLP